MVLRRLNTYQRQFDKKIEKMYLRYEFSISFYCLLMWNAWIHDVALEDLFSSYIGLHFQVMEVYDDVNALFGNKLLDILDSREPVQHNTINPGRSYKVSVSNLKYPFFIF